VPIHPDTTLGTVRLNVADLDRAQSFYERAIGLRALEQVDDTARLGVDAGAPVLELGGRPDAPRRPPGTTGLFHFAILLPSRRELARALGRLADARWPLSGASDHLVSESLYLRDPEANGIEIYCDRPRESWRYVDGKLRMATLPLDVDGVIAELPGDDGEPDGMPPEGRIGHVHLQVADLAAAERFYHEILGFDVTVRGYPGALFVSAGGYHHHVGVNTWAGEGAPGPPPGSLGLDWFEVVLPNEEELEQVAQRLRSADMDGERDGDGLLVADPSGNSVRLTAPGPATSG
jgi:catechol 2,3-dioxygenase